MISNLQLPNSEEFDVDTTCTCRQSDQDDNINAIKTLFPLWLFNIAFLKTIYIMQSQMPSGHLLLSCVKMAATAKISSFAYLR